MAVQKGVSLAEEFGGELAKAAALYKDAPIKTGFQNLPAGIKFGVAKVQQFQWLINESDKTVRGVPKGKKFWRVTAAVMYPKQFGEVATDKMQTRQSGPLCATEKTEWSDGKSFLDNFGDFVSMVKFLSGNTMVCQETEQTDPTGAKANMFYQACMMGLTDPKRNVYIVFSTREFKSGKRADESDEQYKNREPMVMENWLRVATPQDLATAGIGAHNPAAGVNVNGQARPTDAPPTMGADGLPLNAPSNRLAHTNAQAHIHSMAPQDEHPEQTLEDEVTDLVAIASDDPKGETPDGQAAHERLKELAMNNGWTAHQVDVDADTWEQVGDMALNAPEESAPQTVSVGDKFKYASRDRNGHKVKNKEGVEFPAEDVVVATVDEENKTCTLKKVKDNKDVCAVGSRKPVAVKFEWLE